MTQQKKETPRVRIGPGGHRGHTGETARDARATINRLLLYARPYRARLAGVAILVIVSTFASLAGPILLGRTIDQFIAVSDLHGLARTAMTMLGVLVLGGLASVAHGVLMVRVGQGLIADLRDELFGHLHALSMAYHDRHKVGDLMSRVTNDSEAINQVISNGLITFITNILTLAGIMVSMFILNWQLATGTTLLHLAAGGGSSESVELLLALGADVRVTDPEGRTPLALAVEKGRTEVVGLLRRHEAGP